MAYIRQIDSSMLAKFQNVARIHYSMENPSKEWEILAK
jgi:hypothetical protein